MIARSWNLLEPPAETVARLAADLGISGLLAAILVNRGVADPDAGRVFLDPSLGDLHDPLLMRGMTDAVFQVVRAVRARTPILIWGDFDADGVTATALLVEFLRRHTPAVSWHIPHRIDEGYGLAAELIRRRAAEGTGLLITVDCGISNAAEIAAAREAGLAVVVTDHHEPPEELPDADAILNPRRPGCTYPFKSLAGVGIAFKLAQALARLLGPGTGGDGEDLRSFLDLVAIGTVADVSPLVGENRVLVSHGLDALDRTPRPGLAALREVAGLDRRPVRAAQIGFGLAPRINAAGRVGHAGLALELLLESGPERARDLARALDAENRRRQQVEAGILAEARAMIREEPALLEDRALVLASPGWHPGVLGIVASRLAERHGRPAILVATGSDPGRGSARSVADVDLYSHLRRAEHLLVAWGGHAHAAGLAVRAEDLPELRRHLGATLAAESPRRPAPQRLDIDGILGLGGIRAALSDELRRLAPFGNGNPEPTFLAEGVRLRDAPRIVGNNHLRLALFQKPHVRQFIGFGMGELAADLAPGMGVSIVYDLDLEGGGVWERCRLRDLRPSGGA